MRRENGSAAGDGGDSYSNLGKLVSKATKPTPEAGYTHLDEVTQRVPCGPPEPWARPLPPSLVYFLTNSYDPMGASLTIKTGQ